MTRIAVVGLGCRYPDAASPAELWENVVAGRRAFRRMPDERTNLADYWAEDPAAPDRFYARQAAVIKGYEFDRVRFRVAGSTYRSTDLTHWLALDVAARALEDAGFPDGDGLPRERTGVVVGNTLTGEFTRAGLMRLRWPYVRRVVAAGLAAQGWDDARLERFLGELEASYKSPFPAMDEDGLAGGLSNTIAGRICNQFDLHGGGYTVDGACSSSLLSVVTACNALTAGDIDVAVAGGVDLSIDPFELVGFAKTGALARREMRVYDRDSNGFWPGEGCGMVVLMREADALVSGHRVYATLAGWGVSSDGRGGITRPEATGYQLALRRAYARAGFDVSTVPLFEGHGTGTAIGDATELRALSAARREGDPAARPAAIGSIKGMIGHTKAAAGVAGLIKAVLAVRHRVVPPTTGCVDPHPELTGDAPALRVVRAAEPWPADAPLRAGVTAMGFGGINTHVVLDGPERDRPATLDGATALLARSVQDAELLLVDADCAAELRAELAALNARLSTLAYAELADLAATLHRRQRGRPWRAALVATSPEAGARRAAAAVDALDRSRVGLIDPASGVFLGHVEVRGRIGYLFPGQGSGRGTTGGALRRRFAEAEASYARAALPTGGDIVATAVAQPRIVTGSAAALRVLTALGLRADVAVGHSLGEITALHWAGAMDERALLDVATVRGATMAQLSESGSMAGVAAGPEETRRLIGAEPVVIAGYNGPGQTVVAGPADAVERVCRAATEAGLLWGRLAVSHAFHSPLMAPAADRFGAWLAGRRFDPLGGRVVSTVTGGSLAPDADLRALLRRQVTEPVQFASAVAAAAAEVDLLLEVGPGQILTRMARDLSPVPAVSVDTDSESLAPLLSALGAAYARGAVNGLPGLFDGRLARPLDLAAEATFFANPCEAAPRSTVGASAPAPVAAPSAAGTATGDGVDGALPLLRRLAAERAELPIEVVNGDSRLLDDLHLSSITVGQVVNQAARDLGLPAAAAPTNFATATVRELAEALEALAGTAGADDLGAGGANAAPAGVAAWVRPFTVDLVPTPVPGRLPAEPDGAWQVFAPAGHPLAEPLRRALGRAGVGRGVLVCLPDPCPPEALADALAGAQAAARQPAGGRLVLVQRAPAAAGLAKTARLETPGLRTTVVTLPWSGAADAVAVDRVVAEVAATVAFTEAHYDADGARRTPVLRPLPPQPPRPAELPLDRTDHLLVTGGGKGITAECAAALAAESGARLTILGRSDPERDAELAANLARLREHAGALEYVRVDLTDPAAVRSALAGLAETAGPVTAVLHGAGFNAPAALSRLDAEALRRAYAPKVDGLRAVLAAVDPSALRLLVALGSIIGRAGLRGEAHYALANEALTELVRSVPGTHPGCRAVCLEWSVWSGVGMGERLAVVESLERDGVTAIPPELGIKALRRVLADPTAPPVVVVSGRTGGMETLRYERPELPLLRFIERPLVYYHGVELVAEVDLTPVNDRYLDDHLLDGNLLFPAVFGLDAMAQAATAVLGHPGVPVVENARFERPIVVPPGGSTTVRVAALVLDERSVDVVIRSAETGYAADHFRATMVFRPDETGPDDLEPGPGEVPPAPLEPAEDLYGGILFQGDRFRRLRRYRRVAARRAEADVAVDDGVDWFSDFLPGRLVLGDPGARDAFMHGIQVCVPDATLLPAAVARIWPAGPKLAAAGEVTFVAQERAHHGDTYVYDVAVRDPSGAVIERWEGLTLRAVRRRDARGPWAPALLGPVLQRHLAGVLREDVAVAVRPGDDDRRRDATVVLLSWALGRPTAVRYRLDGRPEVQGDWSVSAAHNAAASLAVAARGTVACDLETVVEKPATVWADLLGGHEPLARLIAAETGEPFDAAATRVWCAIECVQKAGLAVGPLTLPGGASGPWVVLAAGGVRVATLVTRLTGVTTDIAVAVLGEPATEGPEG